ncbi:hypothetical protein GLYMA_04G113900v4 [Glycine max]|uniref:Uncharacterized protein n=1 Tax=Glycine max TaxID=3847 RepID=K7KJG8_SOYBN|nr:hypothetical protein JHK86_009724 [Glycine max]KAH1110909.1 hypothetical protein GYH30_009628 [Glycine max]KRH62534.1 hypothetical protein GLYMA_04G113900v4 [Glycine max]
MLKHENLGCFNLDFCEALKAIILSSSPILYSIHLLLCYVFLYKYGSKARPKRCVRFFNNCYCYGGNGTDQMLSYKRRWLLSVC